MKKLSFILIAALIVGLTSIAGADVIIKQKMHMESGGMMNIDMDGTQYVKSDRSCNKGVNKISGGIMAMVGGEKTMEFQHITRLDKKMMWDVDMESKTYTETMLQSLERTMSQGAMPGGIPDKDDPTDFVWTVEVEKSDEKIDINGFECKKITGKANGVHENDPDRKMRITYEYWYAKDVPAMDELTEFSKGFADIAGVDMMWSQNSMSQFFGYYGDQFNEMSEQMQKAGGYPIKTAILMESTEAMGGGGDEDYSQIPPEMRAMMGLDDKPKSEDGMNMVFNLTTEVQSIEKGDVDDSEFEIPEGYSKHK